MARFELQFPASEINALAARYTDANDGDLLAFEAAARARGYDIRRELIDVCAWNTHPQPRTRCVQLPTHPDQPDPPRPELSATNESEGMTRLLEPRGVRVPTASTLLYVAFPADYPILDVRALESLGAMPPSTYPVSFWLRYLDARRELARVHGVSVRTLNNPLWQHSKERSAAPRQPRVPHL